MKASLMLREDLEKKAHPIVNSLLDHSSIDALRIISVVVDLILEQSTESDSKLNRPVTGIGPNLIPNPVTVNNIDKDPEIRTFIHSYSEPITQKDLYLLLVKKFGKKRAPSYSGLNRYLIRTIIPNTSKHEASVQVK